MTLEDCKIIYEKEKETQFLADFELRYSGGFESALHSVNYKAEKLEQPVLEIAASYFTHLACGHNFIDGNKRFAVTFSVYFLQLNGYQVLLTNNSLRNLAILIAHENVRNVTINIKKAYVLDIFTKGTIKKED